MKIDIHNLVKGHPQLVAKLEQVVGAKPEGKSPKDGNRSDNSGAGDSTSDKSRPHTPPLSSISKENTRIRIGNVEVEGPNGG